MQDCKLILISFFFFLAIYQHTITKTVNTVCITEDIISNVAKCTHYYHSVCFRNNRHNMGSIIIGICIIMEFCWQLLVYLIYEIYIYMIFIWWVV